MELEPERYKMFDGMSRHLKEAEIELGRRENHTNIVYIGETLQRIKDWEYQAGSMSSKDRNSFIDEATVKRLEKNCFSLLNEANKSLIRK